MSQECDRILSEKAPCCCSGGGGDGGRVTPEGDARFSQPFVVGRVGAPSGEVPVVDTTLRLRDRLGACGVRWKLRRDAFRVVPGLYAVGSPTAESPVMVTANFKVSFDRLRASLASRSGWILVLDTQGINVWCAAGKGTFGTEELVERLQSSGIGEWLTRRQVIVPQLGAPGIAAHVVELRSGFEVVYGPVRSDDLPEFLDAGCVATPAMRRKPFPLRERLSVVPVELVTALKYAIPAALGLALVARLGWPATGVQATAPHAALVVVAASLAVILGAVLTPAFLPWIPGRAFSLKGVAVAIVVGSPLVALYASGRGGAAWAEALGLLAVVVACSGFLALNFTGASTYTSLSGVRKEMRVALPPLLVLAALGLGLWIASRFFAG